MKKYLDLILWAIACLSMVAVCVYLHDVNQRQTRLIEKVTPMIIEMDTTSNIPRALELEDSIKTEFVKYWLNDDTSK